MWNFSGRWALLKLALPALALVVANPASRADNLDAPLAGFGDKILRDLRSHDVKNVAVLPFRVKKGDRPESFVAGPINNGMATRVENALIMNLPDDESRAIGVARHAAGTAARAKVGEWYSKAAERKKLFAVDYPLAWGDRKVKVDAFITGLIENTGDREKTRVKLEVFFKADPQKLVTLREFTVDTDRSMLADMGYNFALSRSSSVRSRSGKERDKMAASLVKRRDSGQQAPPDQGEAVSPRNVKGLTVKVQYDGAEQEIRPFSENGQSQEYYILPIRAGTKFSLSLTYNGSREDKIGAIVKVNGLSTWQGQTGDSLNLQKWLYSKEKHLNRPDLVEGIYTDTEGKNVKPFTVITGSAAQDLASQLERAGYIDIDVFESGPGGGDERMQISTRGASRSAKSAVKPRSATEARSQLMQANFVKRRTVKARDEDGGLLTVSDEAREAGKIEQGELPNARLAGHLTIKYYDPKTTQMSISK